ncbi:MAG: hypothetical protein IJB44_05930 [Clostridia bacterium]|nr:hypothetical protein [Clostridia bacterium]
MKKTLEEKYANPGKDINTGTIVVLGVGFFLLLLTIFFSVKMGSPLYIIGIVLLAFCVLVVNKNLREWIHGIRRTQLIKSGKLKLQPKKSYNREHRFDEE